MGKFEGKIATNWPSEREKIKKGLKIDIEWLCPHAFNWCYLSVLYGSKVYKNLNLHVLYGCYCLVLFSVFITQSKQQV